MLKQQLISQKDVVPAVAGSLAVDLRVRFAIVESALTSGVFGQSEVKPVVGRIYLDRWDWPERSIDGIWR
jgi:hypothetical protein